MIYYKIVQFSYKVQKPPCGWLDYEYTVNEKKVSKEGDAAYICYKIWKMKN